MRKLSFLILLTAVFVISAFGQKIGKPTTAASEPTDDQRERVGRGVELHRAGKVDEAIAIYRKVLEEDPRNTLAMYELVLSLDKAGKKDEALKLAIEGTSLKSRQLPLFYVVIANLWDDSGKGADALKLYGDALEIVKNDLTLVDYLSNLYFNMGITYARQKRLNEAREAFKNAATSDFTYPSPHALLVDVFSIQQYSVPAFLAAMRLYSLEPSSKRGNAAGKLVYNRLVPKRGSNNEVMINMSLSPNKDEGDFVLYDFILPTLTTVDGKKDKKDKNDPKDRSKMTPDERFEDAIVSIADMFAEDEKLKNTFVGRTYVPFLQEMKTKNFVKAFASMLLADNGSPDALKWVKENRAQIQEFLDWSQSFDNVRAK